MRRLAPVALVLALLVTVPATWAGSRVSPQIEDDCGDSDAGDPLTAAFTDIKKVWMGYDPTEGFPFGIHLLLCEGDINPLDPRLQTARYARSIGWEISFEPLWEETTWTLKIWTHGDGRLNRDLAQWRMCADGQPLYDYKDNGEGEIIVPADRENEDDPWIEVRSSTEIPGFVNDRSARDIEMLDGLIETRARGGNYSLNGTPGGVFGIDQVRDLSACGAPLQTHDFAPAAGTTGDGFFQLPQSGEENRFEQGFISFPDDAPQVTISQDGSFSYSLNMTSQAQWTRNATFTADAPPGWQTSFDPRRLPVPANGYNITTLDVKVPRHARTGPMTLTLNATISDLGRPIENITWTIPVHVREYPRSVSVTAGQADKAVRPGNNVDYVVTIHNTGRLGDRYSLVLEGGPGWETTLAADNVTLAAGANARVGMRIHVPADVAEMRDYTHTFVVTSTIDGVTSAEQVLTTGVLLPPDRPDDTGLVSAMPSGADVPADYLHIVALGMLTIGVVVVAVLILLALGIL